MKKKNYLVSLDPEVKAVAMEMAIKQGRSFSSMIEKLLREHIKWYNNKNHVGKRT